MSIRPSLIRSTAEVDERTHVYPQSTEPMGPVRRLGKAAGLQRIGVNIQRLPPHDGRPPAMRTAQPDSDPAGPT